MISCCGFKRFLLCPFLTWFDSIVTVFHVVFCWFAVFLFVCLLHQMSCEITECGDALERSQREFEDKCRNVFLRESDEKSAVKRTENVKTGWWVSAGNSSLWISSTQQATLTFQKKVNFVITFDHSLKETAPQIHTLFRKKRPQCERSSVPSITVCGQTTNIDSSCK